MKDRAAAPGDEGWVGGDEWKIRSPLGSCTVRVLPGKRALKPSLPCWTGRATTPFSQPLRILVPAAWLGTPVQIQNTWNFKVGHRISERASGCLMRRKARGYRF